MLIQAIILLQRCLAHYRLLLLHIICQSIYWRKNSLTIFLTLRFTQDADEKMSMVVFGVKDLRQNHWVL